LFNAPTRHILSMYSFSQQETPKWTTGTSFSVNSTPFYATPIPKPLRIINYNTQTPNTQPAGTPSISHSFDPSLNNTPCPTRKRSRPQDENITPIAFAQITTGEPRKRPRKSAKCDNTSPAPNPIHRICSYGFRNVRPHVRRRWHSSTPITQIRL
jgi:hypothetical protein